jgi:hypothetical protein
MAGASKLRVGLVVTALLGATMVSGWLLIRPAKASSLSLVFQRYSTRWDSSVGEVAFLWITNASDQTYALPMTGGTNTALLDMPMVPGLYLSREPEGSYLILSEFSDQAPRQLPIASLGQCVVLDPHSALRLRVALPPDGRRRKVGVLCVEMPSGHRPFWTNHLGSTLLGVLPRSVAKTAMGREPELLRVWCAQELSLPAAHPANP